MLWKTVPHTPHSRRVTIALLLAAAPIELATYSLLRSCGFPVGSRSLHLLTLFPGGIAWFAAFWYAFYFRVKALGRP